MAQSSTNKAILKIALPSIVSNITVPLLGLVDMAIVGHLGQAAYIGAISVGGMIFNLCYWLFAFLRMGTGGLTSQAYGAGNREEISLILARTLMLSAIVALVLIAFQLPIANAAFRMIDSTPEVEALARCYFGILIWGAPAVLGLYGFTGWFLGMQNAHAPMAIAIVQNLVNIAASLLLVVGLGMKVEGVAIGSLIAQYSGLAMAVCVWIKKYAKQSVRPDRTKIFESKSIRQLAAVNRDIFLRTLCIICVTTYFTSAGARQGNLILAANALLMQFFIIFSYVMDGFAYAGEALSGRFLGAKDEAGFKRCAKCLFVWGTGLAIVATILYWCLGNQFVALLTNDSRVISTAAQYLPYAVAIPIVSFAAFLLDGIFIGTTSTRQMLVGMASAAIAFFVAYLSLAPALENHALWLAFVLYLLARTLVQGLLYRKVEKKVALSSN